MPRKDTSTTEQNAEEFELTDFEEEYFDACLVMGFRPHNVHTQKQIDRKHDKILDQIDNGELTFDDDDREDSDILDEAYDFFSDNVDEIEEYLKTEKEEKIKAKFEYYKNSNEE